MTDAKPAGRAYEALLEGPVCFDATVPRHLARIGALEVLLNLLNGRARWPEAVTLEWHRAKSPGIKDLRAQLRLLGREARVAEADEQEIEDLRRETFTRGTLKTTTNRGEAECVVLCERQQWPLVIHDDTGIAWVERRGVSHFTVIDVLLACARAGVLKPAKAWRVYEQLLQPISERDNDRAGMFAVRGWPGTPVAKRRFMAAAADAYSRFQSP